MLLTKDAQQEACGDGGADNAGHVGAHGVHQQEVGGVVLLADHVGNTGCHGNCGNTGRADEGVDLTAGEQAKQFAGKDATGGGEGKGYNRHRDCGAVRYAGHQGDEG